MARNRTAAKLHLLTAREVQAARDGDHSDGGGLLLRVRGESASWVLRYTSPAGRRREMGLGVAVRGSPKQAGESPTAARDAAHLQREHLRKGVDPIDHRDAGQAKARGAEQAGKAQKAKQSLTLARAARDYHERVVCHERSAGRAACTWRALHARRRATRRLRLLGSQQGGA